MTSFRRQFKTFFLGTSTTSAFYSILFALLLSGTASATTLSVLPGSQVTVLSGDQVEVDLNISGLGAGTAPSVGVYDVALAFDPTILSFTNVSWGTGLDIFGLGDIRTVTTAAGTVELFELSLDSAGDLNSFQPAAFLLASISFTGINAGTSDLSLSVIALGDASGANLPANIVYGPVTNPVPEPSSWLLLLSGGGLLWRRSRAYSKGD